MGCKCLLGLVRSFNLKSALVDPSRAHEADFLVSAICFLKVLYHGTLNAPLSAIGKGGQLFQSFHMSHALVSSNNKFKWDFIMEDFAIM